MGLSWALRFRLVFVALLISIFLPLLIFSFVPIYILRYLTSVAKRIFRKDLGNLIPTRSAVFACDSIWKEPRAILVIFLSLEGKLELQDVKSNFRKRILIPNAGGHMELTHFPSTWGGFPVWKPEKPFLLDDHIKEYNGTVQFKEFDEDALFEVGTELTKRAFLPEKSPWEIYLFQNYVPKEDPTPGVKKTGFMLRIHHSLADGFSLVRLIGNLGGNDKMVETALPNFVQRSLFCRVAEATTLPIRLPYDLATMLLLNTDPLGPFHLPQKDLSRNILSAVTPQIPLSYIKRIKNDLSASTTGVIVAAIAGALRRVVKESRHPPQQFNILTALPLKGHPEKLRNHMTAGLMPLPIDLDLDPLDRLQLIERNINQMRRSTFPIIFFYLAKAFGGLYPAMTKFFCSHYGPSGVLTNFPGASKKTKLFEVPVLDNTLFAGLLPGNIGIGISSLSYNGNLRVGVGIDESILPNSGLHTKRFVNYFLEELDKLAIATGL